MIDTRYPYRAWLLAIIPIAIAVLVWQLGLSLEHLLLGWIYFPLSALPRMTVYWPSVLVGIASIGMFLFGLHRTLIWARSVWASAGTDVPNWSINGTLAIAFLLLLLFVAGTAMIGATHQLTWLATGRFQSKPPRSEPTLGLLGSARESARRMSAHNAARQLRLGLSNYEDKYYGLPVGGLMDHNGELLHGWAILSGPYMGFYADDIDYAIPWRQPPNDRIYKCGLRWFVNDCMPPPFFDDEGYGVSHFAGNAQVMPVREIPREPRTAEDHPKSSWQQLSELHQVLSPQRPPSIDPNTVVIGTVGQRPRPWGYPANIRDVKGGIDQGADGFGGPKHWQGAMFVMWDGSVRFVKSHTDSRVLQAMGTPGPD